MITAGEAIKKFCEECVHSNKPESIKNCGGEYVDEYLCEACQEMED